MKVDKDTGFIEKAGKDEVEDEESFIIANYYNFSEKCSSQLKPELTKSDFAIQLIKDFDEKCVNQNNCTIDLDHTLLNDNSCLNEIYSRKMYSSTDSVNQAISIMIFGLREIIEPELTILTTCQWDEQSYFYGKLLSQEEVHMACAVTDIVCMIVFMIFIQLLMIMQKDYVKQFDEQAIEMKDFAIKIEVIP